MRLDKLLANSGYGSRSDVKELVRKGRVTVNGTVVKDGSVAVSPSDTVEVRVPDGRECRVEAESVSKTHWFMLNKPAGFVSANSDRNDRTVIELFDKESVRGLFTVGRLDKDTEGLLLVTDDGELGHFLLSPRREVPKTYYAEVTGMMKPEYIRTFEQGIQFSDYTSKPAILEILETDEFSQTGKILVTVTEGKYHEVKRLVAAVGCEVSYLKRIRFAGLNLDETLLPGEYRPLSADEITALKVAAGCK